MSASKKSRRAKASRRSKSYGFPEMFAYVQDSSNSDTHREIGMHDLHTEVERTTRNRPGFNIYDPMIEDDDAPSRSFDSAMSTLIDNSLLVYIPIKLKSGVTVKCRPDVLARCPSVLRDLNRDVEGCLRVLPKSVHALLRRTKIWVNTTYYYGQRHRPRNVNHSTAHHHEGWLFWARDIPEKAESIEIYNCFDYQAMRLHWNGCGLLLHEFCHLIHQLSLPDGLDNAKVIEAFEMATKSGLYNNTLRRDWAGLDVEDDMAYCMVNHKEFFAEMSVTYLADAYHEFDLKDKSRVEDCSPPLVAPTVVERVRSNACSRMHMQKESIRVEDCLSPLMVQAEPTFGEVTAGATWPVANSIRVGVLRLLGRRDSDWTGQVPHCNKFYPFTKGQLQKHDPDLSAVFEDLWSQIGGWHDEDTDKVCLRLRSCWPK